MLVSKWSFDGDVSSLWMVTGSEEGLISCCRATSSKDFLVFSWEISGGRFSEVDWENFSRHHILDSADILKSSGKMVSMVSLPLLSSSKSADDSYRIVGVVEPAVKAFVNKNSLQLFEDGKNAVNENKKEFTWNEVQYELSKMRETIAKVRGFNTQDEERNVGQFNKTFRRNQDVMLSDKEGKETHHKGVGHIVVLLCTRVHSKPSCSINGMSVCVVSHSPLKNSIPCSLLAVKVSKY